MITFLSKYVVQILGGALAVSLLGNVFFGIMSRHYAGKYAECQANVLAVNTMATEKKAVVEKRQDKNVIKTQDRVSRRIADVTRLRNESRKPDLTRPQTRPTSPDGESREAVVLPDRVSIDRRTYEDDQRICVVNTIKAEEWQTFYVSQVEIFEEENVGTNP